MFDNCLTLGKFHIWQEYITVSLYDKFVTQLQMKPDYKVIITLLNLKFNNASNSL